MLSNTKNLQQFPLDIRSVAALQRADLLDRNEFEALAADEERYERDSSVMQPESGRERKLLKNLSGKLFFFFWVCLFALLPSHSQGFNYSVNQVPYNGIPTPSNTPTPVLLADNQFSSVIDIGFPFAFFDVDYTQIIIGANGIVSFDMTQAGLTCSPDTTPIPNSMQGIRNSIMLAWQPSHIDPTTTQISYYLAGEAPYRQFVVYFNSLFNGDTPNFNTESVILYESTNIIEIVIAEKTTSFDYDFGSINAVEGIQNDDGTEAFPVPGRNATNWILTDNTVRFSPQPRTPKSIYGQVNVSPGSFETYSIPPVEDAFNYVWSVPSGWTIKNNTETSITVKVGESGGIINVIAINPYGMSQSPSLVVSTTFDSILPPTQVKGKWKHCLQHSPAKFCCLIAWSSSPSAEVCSYRIYQNNKLVGEVQASDHQYSDLPKLNCKKIKYTVKAVGENGQESSPATVWIKKKTKKKKV